MSTVNFQLCSVLGRFQSSVVIQPQPQLTVRRLDQLELVGVGLGEPLDDVDLHQRHLHGVHVLRTARRVRHPQLQRGGRQGKEGRSLSLLRPTFK